MLSNRFSSRPWRKLLAPLWALILACASGAGVAGDDHDRARQALEAGEVLPLRAILERVERDYPGQVVDVELEREHAPAPDRWVYKVKVLRTGGNLVKLKLDARDGTLIGKKAQGEPDRRGAGPLVPPAGGQR